MTEHSQGQNSIQVGQAATYLPRFLSSISEHAKRLDPSLRPSAKLALAEAEAKLKPASKQDFAAELTACLSLVAPVGMGEDERKDWLRAACIPSDLLSRGCAVARRFCDHHAKIVPAILNEVDLIWKRRRTNHSEVLAAIAKMDKPPLAPEERCTAEQARQIIKELNLKVDDDAPVRSPDWIPVEQRRAPDRQWYLDRGIDPDLPENDCAATAYPSTNPTVEAA